MKGLFSRLLNAIKGNKIYFGIGLGAVAATMWSKTNRAFYYGLLAVVVLFKIIGNRILSQKVTNYIILGLLAIFAWAFVSEVVMKKDTTNKVTGFFSGIWNKIASYLPKTNA